MRTLRLLSVGGAGLLTILFAAMARADLEPEWAKTVAAGTSLSAGISDMTVDASGNTYVTGTGGSSSNNDVVTTAYAPDGTELWSKTYNGAEDWHDQGRGLALGPDGILYVAGNTPDSLSYANVLLLKYDAETGELLDDIVYSSAAFTSEYGGSVAADAGGNVYVGGGTVGDGGDAMILKFDSAGEFQWKRVWDGPADAPYSQDSVLELLLDPDDFPVALIHGVMASLHPDYVVLKCDPADGTTEWEATWGVSGEDSPRDMEMDADGDIYVTGTGIDSSDKFSTIKLSGSDGDLIWQKYDSEDFHVSAIALALDGQGGVYITGRTDPDGDKSNNNDDFYTVKRDASDGSFQWEHSYGDDCIGCYDVPGDVAIDSAGHVFLTGYTNSDPYVADAITLVLDAGTGEEIDRGAVSAEGAAVTATPYLLELDGSANLLVGGGFYNANTGDVEMFVYRYASLLETGAVSFVRGDCNDDGALSLGDALTSLRYQFQSGLVPGCLSACDSNDNDAIGISDPLLLLDYLFSAGDSPPAPFPDCGVDSSGTLSCEVHESCM